MNFLYPSFKVTDSKSLKLAPPSFHDEHPVEITLLEYDSSPYGCYGEQRTESLSCRDFHVYGNGKSFHDSVISYRRIPQSYNP